MPQSPNTLQEFTQAVIQMSKAAKAALCAHQGGPADSPPIVLWQSEKDLEIVALPMPSDTDEQLMAPRLFETALREGFVQFGKPEFVAFITEAYMKLGASPEEAMNTRRGDLQRRFQEEMDTTIEEIISICTFSPSEVNHNIVIVRYGDDGMPEFVPFRKEEDAAMGGAIADVVRDFLVLVNAG